MSEKGTRFERWKGFHVRYVPFITSAQGDVFPTDWALGQGTDQSGNPFLTGEEVKKRSAFLCNSSKMVGLPEFSSSFPVSRRQFHLARGLPCVPGVTIVKIRIHYSCCCVKGQGQRHKYE